jgi:hypothetical protein
VGGRVRVKGRVGVRVRLRVRGGVRGRGRVRGGVRVSTTSLSPGPAPAMEAAR